MRNVCLYLSVSNVTGAGTFVRYSYLLNIQQKPRKIGQILIFFQQRSPSENCCPMVPHIECCESLLTTSYVALTKIANELVRMSTIDLLHYPSFPLSPCMDTLLKEPTSQSIFKINFIAEYARNNTGTLEKISNWGPFLLMVKARMFVMFFIYHKISESR